MRVRVVDPRGPSWTRAILPLVGALFMVLPLTPVPLTAPWFLVGLTLAALGPFLALRQPAREAELVLGAGHVDVAGAGRLNQRIRGRELSGASAAKTPTGVALTLQRKDRPVTLELESEGDADEVRKALGIGHHGFGQVEWLTQPDDADKFQRATRIALGLSSLLLGAGALYHDDVAIAFGILGLVLGALIAFITLLLYADSNRKRRRPRIVLEPRGVIVGTPYREIPYADIAAVDDDGDRLALRLRSGEVVPVDTRGWRLGWRRGLGDDERRAVVAQIESAAGRAAGRGAPEPAIDFQIEGLARRDDDAKSWLARLEATAQRMRVEGGYRATTLPREELWAALENHDAPADVRAGAARVLCRVEPDPTARERIERIAASSRDRSTEKRIRVALSPDLDEAARELEALDDDVPPVAKRLAGS